MFISHVTSTRRDVGELGDLLDRFGFSSFVAHADIEPSREWSNVIEEALTTCDVLVAYLTCAAISSLFSCASLHSEFADDERA